MPSPKTPRILFICKKLVDSYGSSVGLLNSAAFTANGLERDGYATKTVAVDDMNSIDREVSLFRPTHTIIEAVWVVPQKFIQLIGLHPSVAFVIHIHSKTPFLAMEGNVMNWIFGYRDLANVYGPKHIAISPNSISLREDLDKLGIDSVFLPNIYCPPDYKLFGWFAPKKTKDTVDIGCFGAIRPLKNHLIQAIAATAYAKKIGKRLRFHVNSSRIEQQGSEPLKNLRALAAAGCMELVEHGWLSHEKFVELVKGMDMGLQCSFSESFNIVSADFAFNEIPIVVSPDVSWLPESAQADPNDANNIMEAMERQSRMGSKATLKNLAALKSHNSMATRAWEKWLGK